MLLDPVGDKLLSQRSQSPAFCLSLRLIQYLDLRFWVAVDLDHTFIKISFCQYYPPVFI